jgi:hypothetical protein
MPRASSADECSHACPADAVDRDARGQELLDYADVGESPGSSAGEHEPERTPGDSAGQPGDVRLRADSLRRAGREPVVKISDRGTSRLLPEHHVATTQLVVGEPARRAVRAGADDQHPAVGLSQAGAQPGVAGRCRHRQDDELMVGFDAIQHLSEGHAGLGPRHELLDSRMVEPGQPAEVGQLAA